MNDKLETKMMKKIIVSCMIILGCLQEGTAVADEASPQCLAVSEAVAIALEVNPAIREAAANIEAARQATLSARADLLPVASIDYGYTGFKEKPIRKQGGAEVQVAHQEQYNWSATVVQPLFTGFALTTRMDLAKLDVAARQLEMDQVRLDLIRNVKGACYQMLLAERLLSVGNQEVETLSAHKKDAELFLREGLIRPNDLLQAEVAMAHSIQLREKAAADVEKARMALNMLLDRPLDASLRIEDVGMVKDLRNNSWKPAALSVRAVEERPIMKLVAVGFEQLNLSEKLSNSNRYPTVSLVGQYTQSGDDFDAAHNDFALASNASVSVMAQWKVFQGGKTSAESAKIRRQLDALKARVESLQSRVEGEVRTGVLDCMVAAKNIETAEKALAQANENWRITNLQYRQQVATTTDILDARNFLTQADTNYFRTVYGYLSAKAALERAVGVSFD